MTRTMFAQDLLREILLVEAGDLAGLHREL
jgi:hypothetical protein